MAVKNNSTLSYCIGINSTDAQKAKQVLEELGIYQEERSLISGVTNVFCSGVVGPEESKARLMQEDIPSEYQMR